MSQGGDPSQNLLAQAGLVTNEAGRVFEAPCGKLELAWLVPVSRETSRQARQALQNQRTVEQDVRFGWFIVSTESEFTGLRHLLKKDWRRALQAWKGNSFFLVHNRATLHRALYYCSDSERPEAHLRECLRLYYHLSELDPGLTCYRTMQEELVEHLKSMVRQAHESGDDESCSRSMKILSQTVGLVAVSHLQASFFSGELEELRRQCARIQKELLVYQGGALAPSEELLEECEEVLAEQILPEAARFTYKLVEGSAERSEVESLVARACGILSQSFAKAKNNRSAKKWMGEAVRWEPKAVEQWRELPEEDFEEEEAALVKLPKVEKEKSEAPTPKGSKLLGVQSQIVYQARGETREEWVESLYLGFLPLVPIKRFAAYRNLDTMDVAYFVRLPLNVWDYLRHGLLVLITSFVLSVLAVIIYDTTHPKSGSLDPDRQAEIHQKLEGSVQELKKLAEREARLSALTKPTKEQQRELKGLREKRLRLIQEVEELERRKKQR